MIDELGLYNRALAATEVQAIHAAGSAGKCTSTQPQPCITPANLAGWWRGESDAKDSIGTNNGTFPFGSAFATGKVGQALDFDGVSRVVQVPNAPALNPTNAITLEAWVYMAGPYSGWWIVISRV
jgi:hypothetical protein